MENSLLITALERLDKKERKQFDLWVNSPFFNQRKDVSLAYQYLSECLWNSNITPDKSSLFNQLYPNEPYNDHKVRIVMSFINKLLEQFLQYQIFTEDESRGQLALSRAYHQRKLDKHYQRIMKRLAQQIDTSKKGHALHFLNSYHYQVLQYQYRAREKRVSDLNFQYINQELDRFFIISKLRQACLALSHQAVYRMEYELGMLEEALHYATQEDMQSQTGIAIYYHCYYALSDKDAVSHFEAFKQLLFQEGNRFPPEEQQDLYILGINFCTRRYNAGDENFLSSQLELYQHGLQHGFLLSDGQLSRFTYRNIVTLGLILKEDEWVENFIDDYKMKMERKHREGMYNFCLARLAYSRKQYGKALQLLQQATYREPLLHLSAKTVIIKIFYELGEIDPLEAQLESLKTFLRRRRLVISYHKENYSNMLRYIRQLLEINPYKKAEINRLEKTINQEVIIAEKEWLLAQVKKLKQKRF
jgi:hypothetical protein